MSPERVPPYEMGRHDHDDELEQLSELEAFSDGLRAAFPARPLAAEDEHIASMISAAHLLADTGDPVVRPVSNADAPGHQVSWLPKQRRNRMQEERNRSKRVVIKVLAPATVFFALLGGVAWAGGLPAPLQRTASHVAGFAGVSLDDGTEVETPDPAETDAPDPTDNQDGDHQGEDNHDATAGEDNQGDNNDQGTTTGDNSGEDNQDSTSGDDNQGEDNQDSTSGEDNNQGEDNQDSTSGDNSGDNSGEGSGDSGGSSDNSGDSGGDSGSDSSGSGSGSGSGSSGGDGQD